ncbi:MAG TPA: hypothetical protein VH478_00400 [Trebonia sp.]|nr:hypothetical protein [Trebonia sp.]
MFRRTASALGLDAEAIDDGETVVSELAANTLHVRCGQHTNGTCSLGRVSGHESRPGRGPRGGHGHDGAGRGHEGPPPAPELWLYLRGSGEQCELVCKVFDSSPGWAHGGAPSHGGRRAAADAMSGRGLEVVHELSHGRWGYHLTRARLGGWSVRGKAVWFSVPAPFAKAALLVPWGQGGGQPGSMPAPAAPPDGPPCPPRAAAWGVADLDACLGQVLARPLPASQAMARLEAELVGRGFGDTMVRADDPAKDTAVLSVCGELTVWCRAGCAWLRAPSIDSQAWGYGDLVEVAEQVVEAHETLCVEPARASTTARVRA